MSQPSMFKGPHLDWVLVQCVCVAGSGGRAGWEGPFFFNVFAT